jgi:GNAT superfamily N-acetyltransferase
LPSQSTPFKSNVSLLWESQSKGGLLVVAYTDRAGTTRLISARPVTRKERVAVHPSHQGLGIGKEIVSKLITLSSGHKKIILYAVPGKEDFYRKLGFKRMATAMAIFENQAQALKSGLVNDT